MQCIKCGRPLKAGALFCGYCGTPCSSVGTSVTYYLTANNGVYAGARIPLNIPVRIGCDPTKCTLVLPPHTPGVSRLHCTVKCQDGTPYIMDHNSSYGTFWSSGVKLPPNMWVPVTDSFWLGDPGTRYSIITA